MIDNLSILIIHTTPHHIQLTTLYNPINNDIQPIWSIHSPEYYLTLPYNNNNNNNNMFSKQYSFSIPSCDYIDLPPSFSSQPLLQPMNDNQYLLKFINSDHSLELYLILVDGMNYFLDWILEWDYMTYNYSNPLHLDWM